MDSPAANQPGAPDWMRTCESSLADGARTHVLEIQKKRSSYFSIFSIARKVENRKDKDTGKDGPSTPPPEPEPIQVEFRDERRRREDETQSDQFRWAFLYENQRGYVLVLRYLQLLMGGTGLPYFLLHITQVAHCFRMTPLLSLYLILENSVNVQTIPSPTSLSLHIPFLIQHGAGFQSPG